MILTVTRGGKRTLHRGYCAAVTRCYAPPGNGRMTEYVLVKNDDEARLCLDHGAVECGAKACRKHEEGRAMLRSLGVHV